MFSKKNSSNAKRKKGVARTHRTTMKSTKLIDNTKNTKTFKNKHLEMQKEEVQVGGDVDKKFILLHEFNTKENESFIYFMQYTGNEETIASFADFVSKADYDDMEGGDYVKFEIDTENKVSENTADEMIKCNFGSYSHMFSKLTGKMVDPFRGGSAEDMEGDEIATRLSDKFFGNRITKLFVET